MAKGIPDSVFTMLAEADKKYNLPAGTMHAIMQQETGGNSKYLEDPTTYHYGLNADGKRIAGHTGKVSTAFGPFGILESTAADPGFGIKPLKDKASLAEQTDFAAAYASKRGLAAYGEGTKYANQVAARIGNAPTAVVAQAVAPQNAPEVASTPSLQLAQVPERGPLPVGYVAPDAGWNQLKEALPQQPVQLADLNYGLALHPDAFPQMHGIDMSPPRQVDPNFKAFSRWTSKA